MWKNLSGYRTHIGMIAGALLTALYGLDQALHDNPATEVVELVWLSVGTYTMVASLIAGWTGVAVRAAVTEQADKVAREAHIAANKVATQVAVTSAATKEAIDTQTVTLTEAVAGSGKK